MATEVIDIDNEQERRQPLFLADPDDDFDMSPPPEAAHDAPPHTASSPRAAKARPAAFVVDDLGLDDELTREFTLSTADMDLDKLTRDAVAHQRAHQLAQENARKHAQIGTAAVTEVQTKAQKRAAKGEPKKRKPIPKLNDERLLGEDGFPALLKEYKKFKPKGKGHEQEDLTRLLQMYQFWTHKMFPKMQFDDAVARIEKVCHSRRMLISMSVWKDEAKNGPRKPGQKDDDEDDNEDDNDGRAQDQADRSSPGRSSPSSVAAASTNDDNWTVDEMIAAEARKEGRTSSPAAPPASSPEPDEFPDDDDLFGGDPVSSKPMGDDLDAEEMNMDWEAFNDEPVFFGRDSPPPQPVKNPTAPASSSTPAATSAPAPTSTAAPPATQPMVPEDFDMDLDEFDVFDDLDIDEPPSKPQATETENTASAPTPAPATQPAGDTDDLDLLDDGELSQEDLAFLEEVEMYN